MIKTRASKNPDISYDFVSIKGPQGSLVSRMNKSDIDVPEHEQKEMYLP